MTEKNSFLRFVYVVLFGYCAVIAFGAGGFAVACATLNSPAPFNSDFRIASALMLVSILHAAIAVVIWRRGFRRAELMATTDFKGVQRVDFVLLASVGLAAVSLFFVFVPRF